MTTNPPAEKRPLTEKEKTKRRLAEAAISAVVLHIALGVHQMLMITKKVVVKLYKPFVQWIGILSKRFRDQIQFAIRKLSLYHMLQCIKNCFGSTSMTTTSVREVKKNVFSHFDLSLQGII